MHRRLRTTSSHIVGAVSYAFGIFSDQDRRGLCQRLPSTALETLDCDDFHPVAEDGWALGGSVELTLDSFSAGDKFVVSGFPTANNANPYTGTPAAPRSPISRRRSATAYGAPLSPPPLELRLSPPGRMSGRRLVWSAVTGSYAWVTATATSSANTISNALRGVFSTGWTPVTGLDLMSTVSIRASISMTACRRG